MFSTDLIRFIDWIQERWYSRYSILLLLVIVSFFLLLLFSGINLSKIEDKEWFVFVGLLFILVLFWVLTTRLPKNSKNKVGFIIAINTENKEQYKKLKSDFIDSLKEYLNQGNYRHQFKFIIYPDYYSRKIDSQQNAIDLLFKSRAHFMIYGRCRERNIKGKTHFVLNMEGVVSHKPVPDEVGKSFSSEFRELFPRKLAIAEENDLFTFDLISNWVHIVAKYIVGIASLLSGDLIYAKDLFFSLQVELQSTKDVIGTISKIRQRVPSRLVEVLYLLANIEYRKYKITKERDNIVKMGELLSEVEKISHDHYPSNLLRSIYYFLYHRDIQSAVKELKKNSEIRDGTWRFSYAFLRAYEGDLDAAYRTYRNAFRYKYPDNAPIEVEEFINDILIEEPDKSQLYFCLGIINFYAKEDYAAANRDFQLFLDKTTDEEYTKQRKLAKNCIHLINSKIDT